MKERENNESIQEERSTNYYTQVCFLDSTFTVEEHTCTVLVSLTFGGGGMTFALVDLCLLQT